MPSRYGHRDNHRTILQPWSICRRRRREIVITGLLRFLHASPVSAEEKSTRQITVRVRSTRWRQRCMIQHRRPGIIRLLYFAESCTLDDAVRRRPFKTHSPTLHAPVTRRCTTKRRRSLDRHCRRVRRLAGAVRRWFMRADQDMTRLAGGARHSCRNRNC